MLHSLHRVKNFSAWIQSLQKVQVKSYNSPINNQLHTEKWGGHCTSVVLCSAFYTCYKQITMQEISLQWIQSLSSQKITKPKEAISQLCKSTSCCVVSKKNWNWKQDKVKSMRSVLYEKAHLGMKQHWTFKNQACSLAWPNALVNST